MTRSEAQVHSDGEGVRLLAEAGRLLDDVADVELVFGRLCQFLACSFGGVCAIHLAGDDGVLRRVALAGGDGAMAEVSGTSEDLSSSSRTFPAHRIPVTDGTRRLRLTRDALTELVGGAAAAAIPDSVTTVDAILAPIAAHGASLGMLTIVVTRPVADSDIGLAEELARRTASTLAQSRLMKEFAAARTAAEEAQLRIQDLVWSLDAVLWQYSVPARSFTFLSDPDRPFLGYAASSVVGTEGFWVTQFVHPDDRAWATETIEQAMRERRHEELEYRAITATGQVAWVRSALRPLTGKDGRVEQIHGITIDISARKRSEEQVRQSAQLLKTVIDGSADSVYVKDLAGRYLLMNAAGAASIGRPADEVVGRRDDELFDQERADVYRAHDVATMAGDLPGRYEDVRPSPDGLRVFQTSKTPYRDQAGNVAGVIGISRDITEHRALEELLRQSQKMEAIGQLAGGIAHDFNNLLTGIHCYAEMLLDDIPVGDARRADVEEIKKSSERASALTGQLLAFSRKQLLQPRVLDLGETIAGMGTLLRRLIGENIELAILHDPGTGRVQADPGQLEQVLMNLAINARDAMPEGGILTIETSNLDVPPGDVRWSAGHHVEAGAYVEIAVRDTGQGMSDDVKSHLFEPFYTTKPVGKGTGLGLATVYGIVKQSGGQIVVESELGTGSTFFILLPQLGAPPSEIPRHDTPSRQLAQADRATVLLVEDEESVRAVARRVLERGGFTVLEARHGADALAVAERANGIDVLLTDVVMPEMGGRELVERLLPLRPGLGVVYMSGYTDDDIVRRGLMDSATTFVQKPFTTDELLAKVQAELGRMKVKAKLA